MGARHYRLLPGPGENGLRLDRFLAARIGDISRSELRRIIELGGVHAGNRRVRRCSQPVREGELIEMFLDGLPLEPFTLRAGDVLFRDRYLLAVNKPAGVEMQPTPARYLGTLYQAVLAFLQDPFRPLDSPSLGMVQRLDRETSGVVVFSIHPRAHGALTAAMAGREVEKTYLALVPGRPREESGEFRSLLARSRNGNRVKSVAKGGKEAITRYRRVEVFPQAALMEVELVTGRSHQIRAHFAEAGHPLLGDSRYGGARLVAGSPVCRQMLHAWRLVMRHPVEGQQLELTAPVPEDMANLLRELRQPASGG